MLLEAFAKLVSKYPQAHLVLAGDGEMRQAIEARIAELKLADRTTITGWISEAQVRDEIRKARALVLPSFAESLPVVIMEAMALRRPVISTYVAGIPELVRDGETGWLVPAGSIDALSDAMEACLTADAETLTAMGDRGRAKVVQRHAADHEAQRLLALISAPTCATGDMTEWTF
jgi:glycosyltransferase involved in cell wall biosynthesis